MTLDELIAELQRLRVSAHFGALPVVMYTQSGSGEIDAVQVEIDMVENRHEVALLEKL